MPLDQPSPVLVSLTTIPSRAGNIVPTLNSLLDQTFPVEILISIPDRAMCEPHKEYRLSKKVLDCSRVKVKHHNHDTGPSMKFLPALRICSQTGRYLLVVDDDAIYPPTLVENLLHWTLEHPQIVWATRGHLLPQNYQWKNTATIFSKDLTAPQTCALVTGVGGYMFSPQVSGRMVLSDLENYAGVPRGCITMDDVWLSGHLSRQNIVKKIIPSTPKHKWSLFTVLLKRHLNPQRAERNNEAIQYFIRDWKPHEIEQ